MDSIYLDNNATTVVLPEVAEAMRDCEGRGFGNPASQHQRGRAARAALEEAREGIAGLLGANVATFQADRLIFTSGGTEANNLAIRGLAARTAIGTPREEEFAENVVISAIEHPSVVGAAEHLQSLGWQVGQLGADSHGVVLLDQLPALVSPRTRLVSVMLGNNETGVLQPVAEVAERCAALNPAALVHTDATQVVGKLPVDFRRLGVAALTCAAHKFHGPRGIGVLLLRHGVEPAPILHGGFQQGGLRPGTEPVALAVGMHVALRLWQREHGDIERNLAVLRDRLEAGLAAAWPELVVHGRGVPRLPHTTSISFPGLDRQALVMALDLAGVCCSTGSACASGSSEPSPVLLAMGLEPPWVQSALRFSVSRLTTAAEIDEALTRIALVCRDLRQKTGSRSIAAAPSAPPAPQRLGEAL